MPNVFAPAGSFFPTEERFVNVGPERSAAGLWTPGTVAATATTFPIVGFEPEDKPVFLPDESFRGAMGQTYDLLQGPEVAQVSVSGPVYGDMIGHQLYNILGDLTQSAPLATPNTTTTAPAIIGATTITVTAGASFTVGMWILFYVTGSTGLAELVQVLTGASTTITLQTTTPLRLAHATGATVSNTTVASGTYSSIFSLLNSTAATGNGALPYGQPPTHTWTDRTQVPATGLARQYPYACMSELTFTGGSEKLLEWNGSFTSLIGQIASSPPAASISNVRAYPDWHSLLGLNGTVSGAPVLDISEWSVTLSRKVEPYFTNSGQQAPYVIGRGALAVTGKLTFSPATDETALLYMLNNTQPQLQIQAVNGLSAAAAIGLQFDIGLAAFNTSKITASRSLFGYDVTFEAISTAGTFNSITTTGWSGGYSPIKVTLTNSIPQY